MIEGPVVQSGGCAECRVCVVVGGEINLLQIVPVPFFAGLLSWGDILGRAKEGPGYA